MAVANTLAYYDTATITAIKSFVVQAPDHFTLLSLSLSLFLSFLINSSYQAKPWHF
jgi:hypothetical protein